MRRAPASVFLCALLALAGTARADESDKDAPGAALAPAAVAWRVPPANMGGARAPMVHAAASLELLKTFAADLSVIPDGKAKSDVLSAVADLQKAAGAAPADQRQAWVDGHLGDLNAVIRAVPDDAPPELKLQAAKAAARLNGRAERWRDSLEFAEKALAASPDDRAALVDRSRANAGLADFSRAYADAERAAKLAPDSAEAYTARAAASYGLGNYLQAAEDAKRALALDPEDKYAFEIMKLSEGRSKKLPEFEKSQPQLADSVEREYHGMLQQLNQVEETRLAPVEEPGPNGAARLVSESGSKLSVKDYYGAIDSADRALALDPANARALYFRAAAHNLVGEYGEAARDATRGLTMLPADPALHDARAWAYNRMGRFHDAVADAHHSLEVNPRDPYAFANRAFASEQRGDYALMASDYKAAAEINPQFEPVYVDAARRHGLEAAPIAHSTAKPPDAARLARREKRRERSFTVIMVSSLFGGLLLALGILHIAEGLRKDKAPALPGVSALDADYEVGSPVGQGGMGIVYKATDRKLKRDVAVKMLRDEYKLDDAAKAEFLQEARTVAELHHPNIVDLHGIIEDQRGLYLVFEWLDGRTLDTVLAEKGRLPLAEIKRIMKPVCSALEYAHAHDVVHRDLKPGNVMLTSDGGIRVLDFGISRHAARAGAKKVTQNVVGTPHYMAPEQEYGFVQKENDVFSLGAVLYEMATGARPYEGAHQAKMAKAYPRASGRVHGLPFELDLLLGRALEPDPEKRLASPADFWRELDALPDRPA